MNRLFNRMHRIAGMLAGISMTCSAQSTNDWLLPEASGITYPPGEADRQWAVLENDLAQVNRFAKFAPETYCAEALVTVADKDPLGILLRRTTALLSDLQKREACPALSIAEKEVATIRTRSEQTTTVPERRKLFDDLLVVRRTIAFANPLLDFKDLLFIKRDLRKVMQHCCDQFYGQQQYSGGGLFVLSDPFGKRPSMRDMLANVKVGKGRLSGTTLNFKTRGEMGRDGGSILSPAVSYDGKTIAFAFVEGNGDSRAHRLHLDHANNGHWDRGFCYHLFSIGADGSDLTQLTDGTFNDFSPCFTPAGRIAFISERRGSYLRCGRRCPTFTLFDMLPDGSDIRCISYHETNEWSPAITHDGMLLWTRWDYVDRHGCTAHHPWITTPDGRNPRPVHGNYSVRSQRADMEMDCRAIPGSHQFMGTGAPHHGQAFGSLVVIDPRIQDDDAMAPVKRFTPDAGFPESQGGLQTYGTAWPLSDGYALCAYEPVEVKAVSQRMVFGLYLVDKFGNKELIYRDPSIACLNPTPLRATARPPVIPEQRLRLKPGETGEATVTIADVYKSLLPWPSNTLITAIRVWRIFPASAGTADLPFPTGIQVAEGYDSVNLVRHLVGTVPVEKDGSAHFKVPTQTELFFQAVDATGCAVQSMRSSTTFMPGERMSCQGCHEPKLRAPEPLTQATPLASLRPPSVCQPGPDGTRPFSYPRLIQPVLDRHCVTCHTEKITRAKPNEKRPPDLRSGLEGMPPAEAKQKFLARKLGPYYVSYVNLAKPYGFISYGAGHNWLSPKFYRTTPGAFGARASLLYPLLKTGHHGVRLSEEELARFSIWLDAVSQFFGVYEPEGGAEQFIGGIAWPTLE